MKYETILKYVEDFTKSAQAMTATYNDLYKLTRMAPESSLAKGIVDPVSAHAKALDDFFGGKWIDYWWLECELGDHPMHVIIKGKKFCVNSARTLAMVIYHDMRAKND